MAFRGELAETKQQIQGDVQEGLSMQDDTRAPVLNPGRSTSESRSVESVKSPEGVSLNPEDSYSTSERFLCQTRDLYSRMRSLCLSMNRDMDVNHPDIISFDKEIAVIDSNIDNNRARAARARAVREEADVARKALADAWARINAEREQVSTAPKQKIEEKRDALKEEVKTASVETLKEKPVTDDKHSNDPTITIETLIKILFNNAYLPLEVQELGRSKHFKENVESYIKKLPSPTKFNYLTMIFEGDPQSNQLAQAAWTQRGDSLPSTDRGVLGRLHEMWKGCTEYSAHIAKREKIKRAQEHAVVANEEKQFETLIDKLARNNSDSKEVESLGKAATFKEQLVAFLIQLPDSEKFHYTRIIMQDSDNHLSQVVRTPRGGGNTPSTATLLKIKTRIWEKLSKEAEAWRIKTIANRRHNALTLFSGKYTLDKDPLDNVQEAAEEDTIKEYRLNPTEHPPTPRR